MGGKEAVTVFVGNPMGPAFLDLTDQNLDVEVAGECRPLKRLVLSLNFEFG